MEFEGAYDECDKYKNWDWKHGRGSDEGRLRVRLEGRKWDLVLLEYERTKDKRFVIKLE